MIARRRHKEITFAFKGLRNNGFCLRHCEILDTSCIISQSKGQCTLLKNFMSSKNKSSSTFFTQSAISFMKIKNRKGPRMNLRGTPYVEINT